MDIILLSYLPALIGMLVVALFVLMRKNKPMYIAFSATLFTVALWLALQLASFYASLDVALWVTRFSLLAFNFVTPSFLLFSLLYPGLKQWPRLRSMALIFIPPVVVAALSFMPELVSSVERQGRDLILKTGILYDVQTIMAIAYIIIALGVLIWKYRHEARKERTTILMLFLAFLFPLVVGFLANYLWINIPGTQYLLPITLFITFMIIAYAIIRHRLFDIRLVVARSVGYVLLLVTLLAIYASAVFGATQFLFGDGTRGITSAQSIVYFIFAVLLAFTYTPLKFFFDRVTDRIFYRRDYAPQEVLGRLGDITANEINLKHLANDVVGVLYETLKPESACIMITPHRNQPQRQFTIGRARELPSRSILRKVNQYDKKVIMVDYLDDTHESLQSELMKFGLAIVVRLETSREHIGYLFIGTRRSGNTYGSKEEQFFKSIGNELALAIQNSLRFEEIQEFNQTLQDKVDVATERLRNTNRKLRQLDATKDEFVSMASHQLRTPLTSVKGYLSMVLEGDAGNLNPAQEKLLKEAYNSSERMVRLISDFLNVSRLRTGKFVIERTMVNVASLIDGEISQLEATAATRELKLHYVKPAEFPTLALDKGKIQQVIMNLIDNAIFYSHPGGDIWIELIKKQDEIIFRVKDQGIGVPVSERKQLFTKFYRASNARKQRPDGTGIGLFMAQKIIVAHGGAIIFESTEGKGSTFGFRIPIEQPDGVMLSKRLG
jgi:signal transduction histidine kinase